MFSFLILLLEVFQVVIATVASIVFLVLAGLTLAGSAAALTITTPLFIIFSPILVPATIATAVLTTGFTASGTLGAMAVSLIRPRMRLRPRKKSFSGTLGNIRARGAGLRRLRGLLGGKSFPGTIPFGGTPGSNPASRGTPEAGAGLGGLLGGTIPGLFGGTPGSNPASRGTPAAGAGTPEAGAGLGGLLGGTIPGLFGGKPGSNSASGGTPAAGAEPAGGSTPPW